MKEVLLVLARAAIGEAIGVRQDVSLQNMLEKNPWLEEEGAVFVTLAIDGNLRGCIGSLAAHRKLYEDVIYNARSATLNDPRFKPLSKEEFELISIEVSILSKPEPLIYDSVDALKARLRVGIDGVVLKSGSNQATFLPQVWEQLPTFELFFAHLCQKAGLEGDCLKHHPDILTYQVQEYSEVK
ncbi:MAG: AmmeMemoRadiSam system protein A [Sulfurospirillum sp.]